MENMKTPFLSACGRSVLIVLLAWHIQFAAAVPVLAQQGPEQTLQEAPVEEDTTLMPPSAGEPEAAPTQADGVEAAVPGAGEQVPGTPFFDDVFDAPVEHNLSVWGMFLMADRVVRGVMIGLVLASLVTWTVWIAKALELIRAKRRARHALDRIVAAKSLADAADALGTKAGPAVLLVRAAEHEIAMTNAMPSHGEAAGLKERVSSHLSRIEAQAGRRMTRGTGILATIGSTAPFVGLFGTVWGIMNAFIGIAEAQTTNLAIVAPGIAEALLATALGLVAAIPAVVIYNGFARSISGYRLLLGDALAAVERLVSREFDHRPAMGPGTAPHA